MSKLSIKCKKRPTYRRCCICRVWRPISEMKTETDICRADDPSETPVFRFWECPKHTQKQDDRLIKRLRDRFGNTFDVDADIADHIAGSIAIAVADTVESMNVEAQVERSMTS